MNKLQKALNKTMWSLKFLRTGAVKYYATLEEARIDAFYYGEFSPVSIRPPLFGDCNE